VNIPDKSLPAHNTQSQPANHEFPVIGKML